MVKEYVEREVISEGIRKYYYKNPPNSSYQEGFDHGLDKAQRVILDAPVADVAEVRHGRWEAWMPDKNGETREFICTGCRFMVEMSWKQKECDYEWCPYCGCKMDKEETNERI